MADDPATRVRESLTEVTATLVTGIWLLGLFTGQWWWLPALLVGYVVVVPLVAVVYNEPASGRDAVETLRNRYARGELTDEQFERKLERLLETETIEDVEEWTRNAREERDRNLEFES